MEGLASELHLECLGALCRRGHAVVSRLADYHPLCTRMLFSERFGSERAGLLASEQKQAEAVISLAFKNLASLIHGKDLTLGITCSSAYGRGHVTPPVSFADSPEGHAVSLRSTGDIAASVFIENLADASVTAL